MKHTIKNIYNVSTSVALLIKANLYIQEIADIMGYSRSSIQRYLNDPLVETIYGKEIKEIVSNRLEENYINGKIKGGSNANKTHQYVKTTNGRFNGCTKRVSI